MLCDGCVGAAEFADANDNPCGGNAVCCACYDNDCCDCACCGNAFGGG